MGKGKNDKLEFWEVEKRINKYLIADNERKFVEIVKRSHTCPYHLLKKICRNHAIKCGTALIKGQTGHSLDLNVPDETGVHPLHRAASCCFTDFIEVLLQHGARSDVRSPADDKFFQGLLPVDVAIYTLRSNWSSLFYWTPDQSIFQLIITLCLPHWKIPMDCIRLLAFNTRGIGMEMYRYAKEGKLVKFVALLMAAGEKINTPFVSPDEDGSKLDRSMTVRQVLATEIKTLINEKGKRRMKKGERNHLMSTLLMLDVSERAGEAIKAYLKLEKTNVPIEQVVSEVTWLLQKAGYDVKYHDTDLSSKEWNPYTALFKLQEEGDPDMQDPQQKVKEKFQNGSVMACDSSNSKLMSKGGLDLKEQIKDLILLDEKQELISIIQSHLGKENPESSKYEVCASQLLMWMCCHRAVDCAAALLNGELGLTVDLNVPFNCGLFPLHHAALALSSAVIELFLRHGAQTDLRCGAAGSKYNGLLPLDVALETLRHHQYLTDWTPKKSIFKLLFILCLPEMKEPLDAIKLLASKTNEVAVIMNRHVKEGNLIQLAALLMVAYEKVLTPSMYESIDASGIDESMGICQSIISDIAQLNDELKLVGESRCKKLFRMYKNKKAVMMSALQLVEIFVKAGDVIERYLECRSRSSKVRPRGWVPKDVEWLLSKGNFTLKPKDTDMNDLRCFSPLLGFEPSEKLKESGSLIKISGMPLYSQSRGVSRSRLMSTNYMPNQQRSSLCLPLGSPALGSTVQAFHTLRDCKASSGFELPSTVKAPARKAVKSMQPYLPNDPSFKKWTFFASAVKRGLRLI